MEGKVKIRLLGAVIMLLSAFGIYRGLNASVVAMHGGTHEFGGLFDYPRWGIAHFAAGLVFMTLLPFQLWTRFRNQHRTLHRRSGRAMFVAGMTVSVSALALQYTMPSRPVSEKVFMTVFSLVFAFLLIKAALAAKSRDFVRHREWMIRVVAVAIGPLIQRLILLVFIIGLGIDSQPEFWEYFVTSAWLSAGFTILTAEWWIRVRPVSLAPDGAPLPGAGFSRLSQI